MAIKIANDIQLFRALHERNDPSTAVELAQAIGKDSNLVERILRTLAAAHIVEQNGSNTYSTTPFSEIMLTPEAIQSMSFITRIGYPFFASIPDYIRSIGFTNPTGQGGWQKFTNTDMAPYSWFAAHPEVMAEFVGLMKVWSATQESWVDLYPSESLLEGPNEPGAILVDVAGGGGHDIEAFLQKFPQTAGRLVLQDRPEEVRAAKVSEGIARMPHDIFTPQPVKGARVYFMHTILHNHSDEKARDILTNLKQGMKPGYSKILDYEDTIKDKHPTELSCGMDLTMMASFGTGARTESEWESLFNSAGFKLVRKFQSSIGGQCLMELDLAE